MSENAEEFKDKVLERISEVAPEKVHVIFQENAADKVYEQTPVKFSGIISSPLEWLRKRLELVDQKAAHIIVLPDLMTIELITEERDHFKNKVVGAMEYDQTFLKFKINQGEFKSAKEWAALFKKHKYAFDTLTQANELIKNLLNFKAKVTEGIEKARDNKGNIKEEYERQVTENSLPQAFEIKIPIFKSHTAVTIAVEFEVSDNDLSLSLWSDFVQVEVQRARDTALNDVIADIQKIAPDIVVFYK